MCYNDTLRIDLKQNFFFLPGTTLHVPALLIYSLALQELKHKAPQFKKMNDLRITTSNGITVILLSRINFTENEREQVALELGITKL